MVPAIECKTDSWETAYARFETAEEEMRKSLRRLRALGADGWPRDARVLDLFCGSGGGLRALERLGFRRVEGVDLSQQLLDRYRGPFPVRRCDCRSLSPFPSGSHDVVVLQGGLHHLEDLDRDLPLVLDEIARVLSTEGMLALLEPWATPFLSLVHAACRSRLVRRCSTKIDALATMIEEEGQTYARWLSRPSTILSALDRRFQAIQTSVRWGKLLWVGRRHLLSEAHP